MAGNIGEIRKREGNVTQSYKMSSTFLFYMFVNIAFPIKILYHPVSSADNDPPPIK